ncbi:MAG: hypothetical protein J6Y91_03420 [Alphaproteobacteria bacterium]|jgi:hypothetical protein|nr:hypothetical protein [Alphaproteobacteria bacterium]
MKKGLFFLAGIILGIASVHAAKQLQKIPHLDFTNWPDAFIDDPEEVGGTQQNVRE